MNSPAPLKLLILGAHPDDAEYHAGGLASIYRRLGHAVKMVSVTNGCAGHYQLHGAKLAAIRREEAAAAGRVIDAPYEVWDWNDGQLQPTLEVRSRIVREIRTFQPNLVLTHRTNDYHPDHRAVSEAVRDASYLVTVPGVLPDVPALARDPVVAFMPDRFTKPTPLQADVVLDVTAEIDTIVAMLACHRSQMFDWLPYNRGELESLPSDSAGQLAWLRNWYTGIVSQNTERHRARLVEVYGARRAAAIEYAEVYEISEYAEPLDDAVRRQLFPMMPHT